MTNVLGSGGPMRWAASAGGGAPGKYRLAMGIVTVVLVVMAAITIYHSASLEAHATSTRTPFMCVECGYARGYRGIDLRNLPPGATSPSAPAGFRGPSIKCPKCGKLTMVEAIGCPKCGTIWLARRDPKTGRKADTCPKCGTMAPHSPDPLPSTEPSPRPRR